MTSCFSSSRPTSSLFLLIVAEMSFVLSTVHAFILLLKNKESINRFWGTLMFLRCELSDPSGEEDLREREEAAGWRSLSGPAGPRLREELQHVHLPRPLAVRSARPAPGRRVRRSRNQSRFKYTVQTSSTHSAHQACVCFSCVCTTRYLTHTELAPLRAPLIPMEHCTTRFFEECDSDNDKYIALEEWATCFGIKEREYRNGFHESNWFEV